jgi:hypothetical protein
MLEVRNTNWAVKMPDMKDKALFFSWSRTFIGTGSNKLIEKKRVIL